MHSKPVLWSNKSAGVTSFAALHEKHVPEANKEQPANTKKWKSPTATKCYHGTRNPINHFPSPINQLPRLGSKPRTRTVGPMNRSHLGALRNQLDFVGWGACVLVFALLMNLGVWVFGSVLCLLCIWVWLCACIFKLSPHANSKGPPWETNACQQKQQ